MPSVALDGRLGALYDLAPSLPDLRDLGQYRRATGLWRHLKAGGYTMIGSRRARALHRLGRRCEKEAVPGALVDCGCFNGGSSVMLSTGAPDRELWAFDSFQGLPEAGPRDPDHAHDLVGHLVASESNVREAFERFANPKRLRVVRGWFADTLAVTGEGIDEVAILHADGDWYESVRLTLEVFEPKVSLGGWVVIDDYGEWAGAKEATDEYRRARGIDAPLMKIDHTAACWRKPLTERRPDGA